MAKHTQRFSGRVQDYIKFRPSYPKEVVGLLQAEAGLETSERIADIGSGTGILSKMLLECGKSVLGVEPNEEMRAAAENLLSEFGRFTSVAGSAENTTLADSSVDMVTVGQAFHWFDSPLAKTEFRRILRPSGFVVLICNDKQTDSEFWNDYESFLIQHGTDYKTLKDQGVEDESKVQDFFAGNFLRRTLPNTQNLDLLGFQGRFKSISHAPRPDHPGYSAAMAALAELFNRHQENGRLVMKYDTKIYIGHP